MRRDFFHSDFDDSEDGESEKDMFSDFRKDSSKEHAFDEDLSQDDVNSFESDTVPQQDSFFDDEDEAELSSVAGDSEQSESAFSFDESDESSEEESSGDEKSEEVSFESDEPSEEESLCDEKSEEFSFESDEPSEEESLNDEKSEEFSFESDESSEEESSGDEKSEEFSFESDEPSEEESSNDEKSEEFSFESDEPSEEESLSDEKSEEFSFESDEPSEEESSNDEKSEEFSFESDEPSEESSFDPDEVVSNEEPMTNSDDLSKALPFAPYTRGNWSDIAETESFDESAMEEAVTDSPEESVTEEAVTDSETVTQTITETKTEFHSFSAPQEEPQLSAFETAEEPTNSAQPADEHTNSAQPTEAEEHMESAQLTEAEEHTESAQLTEADEHTNSAQPTETEEHTNSAQPTETEEHTESAQPTEAEAEGAEAHAEEDGKADYSVSSDLIRGHINTIILRSLYDGDKYGYEIIAEIERKSHNQYTLKQPSLYSALKRLEKDGYITSYWGGSVSGGRRKYFSLTDEGKEISEKNQNEWEYSRTVIDSLISDKDFDFNSPAPTTVDMRFLRKSTSRVPRGENDEFEFPESGNEEFFEEEDWTKTQTVETVQNRSTQTVSEEERNRMEESLREREEMLRIREEAGSKREQELLEREFALQAEEERREQLRLETEQQNDELREEHEREIERLLKEAAEREDEIERLRYEAQEREEEAERIRKETEETLQKEHEKALLEAQETARIQERERIEKEIEEKKLLEEKSEEAQPEADVNEEVARAKAVNLHEDKTAQNEKILRMESFAEERAVYEERLREQAEQFERFHAREIADVEMRVRAEDEEKFRQREQQIIHQNYINLIRGSHGDPSQDNAGSFYYAESDSIKPYGAKPEKEREYRSAIHRLFYSTLREEPQEPEYEPPESYLSAPPSPEPTYGSEKTEEEPPQVAAARSIDGTDFYDLKMRAEQDGIRICISGKCEKQPQEKESSQLVNKGKCLFLSAALIFLIALIEGSVFFGVRSSLHLSVAYPILFWGLGAALLLVTGLFLINRFGENSLRQTGNILINVIIAFALLIILTLIVALIRQIDFTDVSQVMRSVVIPIILFSNLPIFGVCYYLLIRPSKDE